MIYMVTKDNLQSYYSTNHNFKWLARDFEHNLPEFHTEDEAIDFFTDLFGDDFEDLSCEPYEGDITITYARIVHNRELLDQQEKEMKEKGYFVAGREGMFATQEVQIFSDGSIHMVF